MKKQLLMTLFAMVVVLQSFAANSDYRITMTQTPVWSQKTNVVAGSGRQLAVTKGKAWLHDQATNTLYWFSKDGSGSYKTTDGSKLWAFTSDNANHLIVVGGVATGYSKIAKFYIYSDAGKLLSTIEPSTEDLATIQGLGNIRFLSAYGDLSNSNGAYINVSGTGKMLKINISNFTITSIEAYTNAIFTDNTYLYPYSDDISFACIRTSVLKDFTYSKNDFTYLALSSGSWGSDNTTLGNSKITIMDRPIYICNTKGVSFNEQFGVYDYTYNSRNLVGNINPNDEGSPNSTNFSNWLMPVKINDLEYELYQYNPSYGVVNCYTIKAMPATPMYIFGDLVENPADGWDNSNCIEMDATATVGVYHATISRDATHNGQFKLSTAKGNWDNVLGAWGSTDFSLPLYQQNYGMLAGTSSNNFQLPEDGSYDIWVDTRSGNKLTTIKTDYKFYVLGNSSGSNYVWNPEQGTPLVRQDDGTRAAIMNFSSESKYNTATAYFQISTMLAEAGWTDKWAGIADYRYGPSAANTPANFLAANTLTKTTQNNWTIAPGVYKLIFDPLVGGFTIEKIFVPSTFTATPNVVLEADNKSVKQLDVNYSWTTSAQSADVFTYNITNPTISTTETTATATDVVVGSTVVTSNLDIEFTREGTPYSFPIRQAKYTPDYEATAVTALKVYYLYNSTEQYYCGLVDFEKPTSTNPATMYNAYRVKEADILTLSTKDSIDFNIEAKKSLKVNETSTFPYVFLVQKDQLEQDLGDAGKISFKVEAVYGKGNSEKKVMSEVVTSNGLYTGVDANIADATVVVYPTVTDGILNIISATEVNNISVYSISGALVKKVEAAQTIDLGELAKGIYLIKVDDNAPVKVVLK